MDIQGFAYYKKKESQPKTYWVCTQYKNGCPGTGNLLKDSKEFVPLGDHSQNNVSVRTQNIVKETTWREAVRGVKQSLNRSHDEKSKNKMLEIINICKQYSVLDRKTYVEMICAKLD